MAGKNKQKKGKRLAKDRSDLLADLQANRRRRDKLAAKVSDERSQLSKLLTEGVAAGVTVGELAEQAGISRPHAHRLLARAAGPQADAVGTEVGA